MHFPVTKYDESPSVLHFASEPATVTGTIEEGETGMFEMSFRSNEPFDEHPYNSGEPGGERAAENAASRDPARERRARLRICAPCVVLGVVGLALVVAAVAVALAHKQRFQVPKGVVIAQLVFLLAGWLYATFMFSPLRRLRRKGPAATNAVLMDPAPHPPVAHRGLVCGLCCACSTVAGILLVVTSISEPNGQNPKTTT
eukprot:TRINITY_DN13524_c0_g1_i1.p2 TRINITY_DN13524_c0_g1~~TRINITY_DN13524_c0_g1_i1.p2  ORF type:complete len:200 (+),score=22.28 TRINITY_DN13524_c0_g1_i1:63-662(+)